MNHKKQKGQVFTPLPIVKEMLDHIGYTGDTVLHKTFYEPSFGEGVFLIEAIRRIVLASPNLNIAHQAIQDCVYGTELDEELYKGTVQRLNEVIAEYQISPIDWSKNLVCGSALDADNTTYDFVVGNPPYVRIHNIPLVEREKIKDYRFATGTTDLYIVFFELGLRKLNQGGTLCYITPNSFMKNASQKKFRKFLLDESWLKSMIDFRDTKVFSDASTYATITCLKQDSKREAVAYSLRSSGIQNRVIKYSEITEDAWNFADFGGVMELQSRRSRSLHEVLNAQNGLATLRDKIFIDLNAQLQGDDHVLLNGSLIEKELTRPIVKASKYNGEPVTGRAIYPYAVQGEEPLTEQRLMEKYPLAYAYLLSHRSELDARDMDKGAQWYEYGRSQAINALNGVKYVMSPVIAPHKPVEVFELDEETLVYGGFFVTLNSGLTITRLREIVRGEDFKSYAMLVGKDMSGGYVSINPSNLKKYKYA